MKRISLLSTALLGLSLLRPVVQAQTAPNPASARLSAFIDQNYPGWEELYKHLHSHPELSLHEEQTSVRVADELERAGFTVTRNFSQYGVVGVLTNGKGPVVMIRTDLDALPVREETGAPYASQVVTKNDVGETVGVMHACGHDIHMTSFIGTARVLANFKDLWHGTVIMIGQPAEEKVAGAKAMLAAGLYTKFPKPDYVLALHSSATLLAGTVGYVPGPVLANVDSVDISVRGIGGHGAYPHTTKDPVVLAAQIVLALQTIVSRETFPLEPAVVTVGSIHGGTKNNIIPNEVKLQLTLRSYSQEVRDHTIEAIKRITKGLGQAAGLPDTLLPVVTLMDESCPATINDPVLTGRLATSFRKWLGDERVSQQKPVMAAEDFSHFGRTPEKVPISIFWLGVVEPELFKANLTQGKPLPSLHSSRFNPTPSPTIKTGVLSMSGAVIDLLTPIN